jgi:phospholipid/cholesterol/gamma-HCH transport system ATP-binding protein
MAAEFPVALEGVRMAFGDRVVFRDLTCRFPRGKITVVLGGSGSGKSTTLRVIGGLLRPQAGRVLVEGQDVGTLSERELFGVRRKLGMMFQGGALLDAMTVFDNVAFPLREHSQLGPDAIAAAVHERLAQVGLTNVDALLPGQLSGGMTKRAALARALIESPSIVLCDEPYSGLDPVSVKKIEALLLQINRSHGITMIIVSHHIATTLRSAHQVVLILPDTIVTGSPAELLRHPDPRVTHFLNEEPDATALDLPESEGLDTR